jgi:membrane protein required for colicin V production
MPNTAVDIVVVLVILLSAILAFIRGFVREALALGTWLVAVYFAFTQYPLIVPFLEKEITNPMLRDFASGLVVFGIVMLVLIPIGFYVRSFIKGDQITSIDRSFGFVFGAGRGYLLISIVYLIVSWLMPEEKQPEWLKEANTKPVLIYGANLIKEAIPQEQRDLMEKKAHETVEQAPSGESIKGTLNGDALDKVMKSVTGGEQ